MRHLYLIDEEFSEFISKFNTNNINDISYINKCKIKFGCLNFIDGNLYYPINFDLIENESYNFINELLKGKTKKFVSKVDLFQIKEDIFLIPKDNNLKNENNNFIYLYSEKEKEGKPSYEAISIIDCKKIDINERDKIIKLLTEINNNKEILKNPKILKSEFKFTCYLINNNNEKNEDIKNQNKIQNFEYNKENLDFYLKLAIVYLIERYSLFKIINRKFTNEENNQEKEYYLINKSYINEIDKILHLDKIRQCSDIDKVENDEEMLNIIKANLSEKIKIEINKLNKDDIQRKLNHGEIGKINLYFADEDKSNGLCYFKDCDIITKDIRNILRKIDANINDNCKKINCLLNENKIIIYVNKNILNICIYQKENILVKYIIKSNKVDLLFNVLYQNGYEFISKYLSYNKFDIPIKNKNYIPIEIYKLTNEGEIMSDISNKLKVLILLTFFQNNLDESKLDGVYMVNPEWLMQFKYKKIKMLIDEKFKKIQDLNLVPNNLKSVSKIIKYFDKENLEKINNDLISFIPNSSIQFDSQTEKVKLKDKYL